MNTKQISDLRFGDAAVNFLKLGTKTVWERSACCDDMPFRSSLNHFYAISSFKGTTDPNDPKNSSGSWTDLATGEKTLAEHTHLSDCCYMTSPAPRLRQGELTFDLSGTDHDNRTYYIRMRVGTMGTPNSPVVKMMSDERHGLTIQYVPPAVEMRFYSGDAVNYSAHVCVTNNNDFHTIALVCSGEEVTTYLDGEFVITRQNVPLSEQLTFVSSTAGDPVISSVAAYDGAHDQDAVSQVSSHLASLDVFKETPEEQRTYLYHHGDEKTLLTGGWTGHAAIADGFGKFEDHIRLNGTTPGIFGSCQTLLPVDFTPYRKLCFRMTAPIIVRMYRDRIKGAYYGYKIGSDDPAELAGGVFAEQAAVSAGGRVGTEETDAFNVYLDISGVDQPCYPMVYDFSDNTRCTRIFSVWLEQ